MCPYQAVDSTGQTLDFLLNQILGNLSAKRFYLKVLRSRSRYLSYFLSNVSKNTFVASTSSPVAREPVLGIKSRSEWEKGGSGAHNFTLR